MSRLREAAQRRGPVKQAEVPVMRIRVKCCVGGVRISVVRALFCKAKDKFCVLTICKGIALIRLGSAAKSAALA